MGVFGVCIADEIQCVCVCAIVNCWKCVCVMDGCVFVFVYKRTGWSRSFVGCCCFFGDHTKSPTKGRVIFTVAGRFAPLVPHSMCDVTFLSLNKSILGLFVKKGFWMWDDSDSKEANNTKWGCCSSCCVYCEVTIMVVGEIEYMLTCHICCISESCVWMWMMSTFCFAYIKSDKNLPNVRNHNTK